MSILLSGDLHLNAVNEMTYITKKHITFCFDETIFNKIKYHVILGDCGFGWKNSEPTEKYVLTHLASRLFPILCIFGNHEPAYALTKTMPLIDIGLGEKVYEYRKANPAIYFLQRGKVYTIDNKKILALGGALSIDKDYRVENISWWKEEYWSFAEEKALFSLVEKNNTFDYVFAHTAPQSILDNMFDKDIIKYKINDSVAKMHDKLLPLISFKEWYFGHWHLDRWYQDDKQQKYICKYATLDLIE